MLYISRDIDVDEPKKKHKTIKEDFYDSWQFYEILRDMSHYFRTTMDEIAGWPVHKVLTDLHYQRHKDKLIEHLNKNIK